MGLKASAAATTGTPASGAVYAQMITGAQRAISIKEIVVTSRGLGGEVALARSFSVGTATAAGVATGVAHRAPEQSRVFGRLETAWSSQPSGATQWLKKESIGGATGTRVKLLDASCDMPISVEPTGATGMGLLLVNVASGVGPAFDINVTWEFASAAER